MSEHSRSLFAKATVRIALLGGCGAITLAAMHPAAAASFITAVQSMVTCSTTSTGCVVGANTNSGAGVVGTSKSGIGVNGTATLGPGMYGSSSLSNGVSGVSTSGNGVFGYSDKSYGVEGQSPVSYGVYGVSSGPVSSGVYGSAPAFGVSGTTPGGKGTGVSGNTSSSIGTLGSATGSGIGIAGYANTGYGVYARSSSGTALRAFAQSGPGAYIESDGGNSAIEAFNSVGGIYEPAVYGANSAAGYGAHFYGGYGGVWGEAPASGYPLVATDQNLNTVFDVNGVGDIYFTGQLNSLARMANGTTVQAYSAQSTLPTVEDTGTAQLVGGSASVKLDPTFTRTIDRAASYRVFVTANGDTHGLFVASKSADVFVVRENQAGRSTVSFDYRIVATALGHAGQRMAVTSRAAVMPRFSGRQQVTPMVKPAAPPLPAAPAGP